MNEQIQRWRDKSNTISTQSPAREFHADFTIFNPYVEKGTYQIVPLIKHKRNFAAYFPICLLGGTCKDNKGHEDRHVKDQAIKAPKIVFTKHNACWLVRAPDYLPVQTEVLIVTEDSHHDTEYYTTTDIDEQITIAHCLEIIE